MNIIIDQPADWLQHLKLESGKHHQPEDGMCWMEAIAFATGEDFTDHPECVSPVIAAFDDLMEKLEAGK